MADIEIRVEGTGGQRVRGVSNRHTPNVMVDEGDRVDVYVMVGVEDGEKVYRKFGSEPKVEA